MNNLLSLCASPPAVLLSPSSFPPLKRSGRKCTRGERGCVQVPWFLCGFSLLPVVLGEGGEGVPFLGAFRRVGKG